VGRWVTPFEGAETFHVNQSPRVALLIILPLRIAGFPCARRVQALAIGAAPQTVMVQAAAEAGIAAE